MYDRCEVFVVCCLRFVVVFVFCDCRLLLCGCCRVLFVVRRARFAVSCVSVAGCDLLFAV